MPQKQKKKKSRNKKDGNDLVSEEATATTTDAEKRKWRLLCAGLDDWRFRNSMCLGLIFVSSLLVLNVYVLFCMFGWKREEAN